jgi:hypothetical protein
MQTSEYWINYCRGPPELVQHVLNLIWFGCVVRLSKWVGGGNVLLQIMSTCLPSQRGRGWGRHPVESLGSCTTLVALCKHGGSRKILMWVRSSRVSGWYLAEWLERLTANALVATVLGSIPASSDTVESEGRQMKQWWILAIGLYLQILEGMNTYISFRNLQKKGETCSQKKPGRTEGQMSNRCFL